MSGTKQKLVVVGNGMAGIRTVEELLALSPDRHDITVFGAEPHPNYNRILLSSVLAGEKSVADIVLNSPDWYAKHGITLFTGDPVTGIDADARTLTSASGRTVPYDKLLLATGSKPLMPPVAGNDLPGVCGFRDIRDVDQMIAAAQGKGRAVVIGGGLLGLEAAWGLKRRGMSVAVVHLMPHLMERQLDTAAGQLLQRDLDRRGIAFFTNGHTEEIFGDGRVQGVRLADGRIIPADLVVMAIGIRPDIELARKIGLDANRGIVVADNMSTTDPDIFAVGECAEHRGQCFGLVAPLWDMAKVCAHHLAGGDQMTFTPPALSTRLKITGIDVFSAGALAAADEADEEILLQDNARGAYKKLVLRDGKLAGIVLYGDVSDGLWYFDLMRRGADVSEWRDRIILGESAATAKSGLSVATMADDTLVCGCNGTTKGMIVAAIQGKGLTSLEEVRAHTNASGSCGQCTGAVRQILAATIGADAEDNKIPPVCGCTDRTHEEVRHAILERALKTMPEAMLALGWRNRDDCAKCRPALNYYLLCAWPGEYQDDQRSRFINERVHANIQKDGTYSVVPRLWGGMASPQELAAIAQVAEKYKVREIKITGGQRLGLFGIQKWDLPGLWGELAAAGLVSGHAYGKALRTVKTCVGSEWCRFGTQDSTGLGVKLERLSWASWTPHKFKMGVSGCPRNCAEASIKDFGVVCVDGGYDLLVGGNGGIELRETDPLCRVSNEAEVLIYAGAYMQMYREEARYLERTAPWIDRVGIAAVRARLVEDDAARGELYRRFLVSQQAAQSDPWEERARHGMDAHEFHPLCKVG